MASQYANLKDKPASPVTGEFDLTKRLDENGEESMNDRASTNNDTSVQRVQISKTVPRKVPGETYLTLNQTAQDFNPG